MSIVVRGLPGRHREDDLQRALSRVPTPPSPLAPQVIPNFDRTLAPMPSSAFGGKGPKQEDNRSWWQKGVGFAINNPVVKNILEPLDLIGVPHRTVVSTLKEGIDLLQGEGFSGQEWWEQINPFFFLHRENAESNIGGGDLVADLGGTGNIWGDRALGFALDVGLDPLTYVYGVGVVDKGLDAARAGGALAKYADNAAAKVGATDSYIADSFKGLPGGPAKDKAVADALGELNSLRDSTVASSLASAPPRINPGGRGTRASLAGRRTRNERVTQAAAVVEENLGAVAGAPILDELRRRATRGLGARGGNAGIADLADDLLGINGRQGVRFGVPFTGKVTGPLPGTSQAMGAISQGLGKSRLAAASGEGGMLGRLGLPRNVANGQKMSVAERVSRTQGPAVTEGATEILRRSELLGNEEFLRGVEQLRQYGSSVRPIAGVSLNLLQRAVNKNRNAIKQGQKESGGGAKYLTEIENSENVSNPFTEVTELAMKIAKSFGVVLPRLNSSLNYVPHELTQKFIRDMGKRSEAEQWMNAMVGEGVMKDLAGGSGRMRGRRIRGGVIDVPGIGDVDFGKGTITDINAAGRRSRADGGLGLDYDILETDAVALLDQYVQSVAEDIGKRFARIEAAVTGRGASLVDDESRDAYDTFVEYLEKTEYEGRVLSFEEALIDNMSVDDLGLLFSKQQVGNDLPELKKALRNKEESGVIFHPQIQELWENTLDTFDNPGALKRGANYLTNFFKTYALLTPGFHLRNWMSAAFMNVADGVPMATTAKGTKLWAEFAGATKNGDDVAGGLRYLEDLAQSGRIQERDALIAAMASGAGGRFAEKGYAEASGMSRFFGAIMENPATRLSQRAGSFVEGSIRTGVALDTMSRGGTRLQATARITRLHFDYSETSRFDDTAKRYAPFWSFYSRNIPLQVMQMWARPRAYSMYSHLAENFADWSAIPGEQGEVPDYIAAGMGIPMDLGPFNWLEPDLPHTKLSEDVERLSNITSNPLGMASHLNPILSAPLEYAFRQNAFTGQTYGDDDVTKFEFGPDILTMAPALLAAAATGTWAHGDDGLFIQDRTVNLVDSMNPLGGQLSRLTNTEDDRHAERVARYLGLPVRTITEQQMDSAEYWRGREQLEQEALQRVLDGKS